MLFLQFHLLIANFRPSLAPGDNRELASLELKGCVLSSHSLLFNVVRVKSEREVAVYYEHQPQADEVYPENSDCVLVQLCGV